MASRMHTATGALFTSRHLSPARSRTVGLRTAGLGRRDGESEAVCLCRGVAVRTVVGGVHDKCEVAKETCTHERYASAGTTQELADIADQQCAANKIIVDSKQTMSLVA